MGSVKSIGLPCCYLGRESWCVADAGSTSSRIGRNGVGIPKWLIAGTIHWQWLAKLVPALRIHCTHERNQ